ncbi:UNVERIFIED_CONTAM: hypothetical protein PYX00_005805 [Menopon gallinae]|uniref:Uncharacterized protein n=1 Tax=Menopon gallinae TaxID=328185 RepID=A0AAW2HSZ9_9NEOP
MIWFPGKAARLAGYLGDNRTSASNGSTLQASEDWKCVVQYVFRKGVSQNIGLELNFTEMLEIVQQRVPVVCNPPCPTNEEDL